MSVEPSKAEIIIGALPFIRAFSGKTVVVKYGGNAMVDPGLTTAVTQDLILMRLVGMEPVVVHGGGPQIDQAMKSSGLKPHFIQGLRITDADTMRIVERVLVGEINQEIVAQIGRLGGAAIGLSGKDGGMIRARKAPKAATPDGQQVDLGLVGEVARVDARASSTGYALRHNERQVPRPTPNSKVPEKFLTMIFSYIFNSPIPMKIAHRNQQEAETKRSLCPLCSLCPMCLRMP